MRPTPGGEPFASRTPDASYRSSAPEPTNEDAGTSPAPHLAASAPLATPDLTGIVRTRRELFSPHPDLDPAVEEPEDVGPEAPEPELRASPAASLARSDSSAANSNAVPHFYLPEGDTSEEEAESGCEELADLSSSDVLFAEGATVKPVGTAKPCTRADWYLAVSEGASGLSTTVGVTRISSLVGAALLRFVETHCVENPAVMSWLFQSWWWSGGTWTYYALSVVSGCGRFECRSGEWHLEGKVATRLGSCPTLVLEDSQELCDVV